MIPAPFGPAAPARIPRLNDGRARRFEVLRPAANEIEPRLSVIVPGYDTAPYVVAAVRSLLGQTLRELEVIAVDDGSRDDSVQRLLAFDDPRLAVVRQENRGLSGARNTGILIARAPFIGFCDSDDVWHPDKAVRQLDVMENSLDIGVTFSFSAYLDDDGSPTGRLLTTRCTAPTVRQLLRRNHLGNGSTAIVRRRCFEDVGLFDESLRSAEEWELWVRIAARTMLRFVCVPEPLTGYRIRAGSLSVSWDIFLRNAWIATQRFAEHVDGFTPAMAQRAYAEALRIASRKSMAAGDVTTSRRFLLEALRRSPSLLLTDPRAAAMAVIHLAGLVLPERGGQLPYRALDALLRRVQRLTYARR